MIQYVTDYYYLPRENRWSFTGRKAGNRRQVNLNARIRVDAQKAAGTQDSASESNGGG